jgi:succinate dehydrogenase / fumarate reductase cytochrome b subunit
VLYEDIGVARRADLVVRPLNGPALPLYGCHITRPPQRTASSIPHNVALERLAELLGCRPIDYSGRTECCGFHTAAHDERVAIADRSHIKSASSGGATAMVMLSALSHGARWFQRDRKDMGEKLDMPVLHLPQLVGRRSGSPRGAAPRPAHGQPEAIIISRRDAGFR